jgi:hypothetical protein
MENVAVPLRYYEPQDIDLTDHAWRVGARSREEAQRSIDIELEAYRARGMQTGGAVLSLT